MINKLKTDRLKAMKDKNVIKRQAIEAVISEIDTKRGRGIIITDLLIIEQLKSEIKKLGQVIELGYDDTAEDKKLILEEYLPQQVELEYLEEIYWTNNPANIKDFLFKLDSLIPGQYNKQDAVKVFKACN